MHKKGTSPFFTAITAPSAMILLAIMLVVFGIVFILLSSRASVILEKNIYNPTEDLRLLNYLKTPIDYNGNKIALGNFIIEATSDKDKFIFLQNELKDLLKFRLDKENSNVLVIEYDGEVASSLENYDKGYFIEDTLIKTEISLPAEDQQKSVLVTLYSGKLTYPEQYEAPSTTEEVQEEIFILDESDYPNAIEVLNKKSVGIKLKDPNGNIWINFGKVGAFGDNNYWTDRSQEICQNLEFKSYSDGGYKYLVCDGEISDVIISDTKYQDKFKTSEELYNLYYKK